MPVHLKPPTDAGEIISPGCASRSTPRRHGLREEIGMPIAVIGIGGPYGAALVKPRADVTPVARDAHLAPIRQTGLRVESDRCGTRIWPNRLLRCEIRQPWGDRHVCGQG